MKFKVGDRLRVTKAVTDHRQNEVGKVYTVTDVNCNGLSYYKRKGVNYYGFNRDETIFVFYEDELELAPFTKADLKDGMVVECSDGIRRIYLNNHFMGLKCFTNINAYTDTLECNYEGKTINKVYVSQSLYLNSYFEDRNLTLIWKRQEPIKEMTVEEIEKELGYKVKIVSDDKMRKEIK